MTLTYFDKFQNSAWAFNRFKSGRTVNTYVIQEIWVTHKKDVLLALLGTMQ